MKSAPPRIFDRTAIARARARAERIGKEPFLLATALEGIAHRVRATGREFDGLDLDPFPGAAVFLRGLAASWSSAELDDEEKFYTAGEKSSLATSILALHAVNDLPGVLIQVRRLLAPDGLFVGALLGGDSLRELRYSLAAAESEHARGASPHVAPFADVRDLGNLMQRAGFALPVADVERTMALYRTFDDLVSDLRANALSNALASRSRQPLTRKVRNGAIEHYRRNHAEPDGRLRATFDIIYVVGFAPEAHEPAPQKPLRAKLRWSAGR